MAFVYRADRNMNLLNKYNNETFPGEYFNNSSFIKDIDRQSSEFQSNSKRDLYLSKVEDTPGPGSYERNLIKYNYQNKTKKQKPKDIYEAVKINLIPKEMIKFLEKNQNIAFNSRGQRFNYLIDNFEKNKEYPGPGSYSPNGSSINAKTDYSTILFKNNISKKSNSYNHSNIFPTTYSDYRTETIPSKGNLGYEINKKGVQKMVKFKPNDENLIGPGTYNLTLKKKENGINWSKTTDEKDPKYEIIKTRKNLNILTDLEQNSKKIENLNNKKKSISKKGFKKFGKNAIFTYHMNRRYNMIRIIKNKLDIEKDLIFDADPGPGYYTPDDIDNFYKTQGIKSNYKNNISKANSFQSTSPRFNTKKSILDEKIGPGYYYEKTKPDKIKKFNQKKGHFINANKDLEENSVFNQINIKEEFNIPGPGTYENFSSFYPKAISTNNNFGFNTERFKQIEKDSGDTTPGPGYYNPNKINKNNKNIYSKTTNSLPKFSYRNKNIFTNYKNDLINVKENSNITRPKFLVPPIGMYNPYITTTIEYNNKLKINTFTDKTLVGFGSQAKKTRSFGPKENNKSLGPGIYYKNTEKNVKQNMVPFNQNMKRFDYDEKNRNPGPGTYNTDSYDEWNKKSHNILYV